MERYPRKSRRLASLAAYLRSFCGVLATIAVPLPFPVAALQLLPVFSEHAKIFPILTALLCAGSIGAVFHLRHWVVVPGPSNRMFSQLVPVVLLMLSAWSAFSYLDVLQDSIDVAQVRDTLRATAVASTMIGSSIFGSLTH